MNDLGRVQGELRHLQLSLGHCRGRPAKRKGSSGNSRVC
jgi:hypothetical protein